MITIRLQGGMGNQMFQYSCGRALAIKNNTELQLDVSYLLDRTLRNNGTFREYDLDIFNIQASIVSNKTTSFTVLLKKIKRRFFKSAGTERQFSFDPAVLNLGPSTTLDGYWQSPHYFSHIQTDIRKDFTLKNGFSGSSEILLEEIKGKQAVALHVRRGDYVGHQYHDTGLGQVYYDKGLQYLSEKVAIEKLYVFSDDIAWCQEHLHFPFETMFVGEEYAGRKGEEHLMLMSACQHFIIPNSTFSWWAAWLATNKDKIVVAPKKWFNDPTINTDDLIPGDWIRL